MTELQNYRILVCVSSNSREETCKAIDILMAGFFCDGQTSEPITRFPHHLNPELDLG